MFTKVLKIAYNYFDRKIDKMRIAGICARGIEGTGQTKYIIETMKALESVGHSIDIFASNDKKFGRRKAHDITLKFEGPFAKKANIDYIINEINTNYDLVIIFCLPANKFSDEAKNGYLEILNSVGKKMIYIMVDHSASSIGRNACVFETAKRVNLILVHSLTGAMATWCKNKVDTPIGYLYTSRNFDDMRDKFWKPVEDINLKSATFIGRCADWKRPQLFIDFSEKKLNPNGFITTMEGMEQSFVFLRLYFKDGARANGAVDCVDLSRYRSGDHTNLNSDKLYVYDAYNFNEEMERLSKTGFGADLYTLRPEYYGRSLEQCHNDIVSCGCIPIMSKHFGENCLTLEGKRWIDACPDIVWLDDDNYEESFNKMMSYVNDPELFDKTRHKIYDFFKTQGDVSVIGPKLDEIVRSVMNG